LGEREFSEEDFGLSLRCSITLITHSPEEQDEEEKELKEINNGRDNWTVVPFSSRISLREVLREVAKDGEGVKVSEMEIWRGKEMSMGRDTECWLILPKDSKSV
jgi:hypothetical protein